jgi:predicted transcriptional regulator
MSVVWNRDAGVTVRDVHDEIGDRRRVAYTTVMTVMDRLWKKRVLTRSREGRAYLYRARESREEHVEGLVREALRSLRDRSGVLQRFVDSVDVSDLAELERIVRSARRRRENRS